MQQHQQLSESEPSAVQKPTEALREPEAATQGWRKRKARTLSTTAAWETSIRELVAEAPGRKRLRKRWVALCLSTVALMLGSAYPLIVTGSTFWLNLSYMLVGACMLATLCTVTVILQQQYDPRLKLLAALDEVEGIGMLLDLMENSQEMWEYDDPSRRAIKATLIRLLPRLRASDTAWMTKAQRDALARTLYFCTHRRYPWHFQADLAVALLAALEQVGDPAALKYVEELAADTGRHPDRIRIREAARACLPFLQERAREQEAEQTLLRASQITIDPAVLVRPLGAFEPRDPKE